MKQSIFAILMTALLVITLMTPAVSHASMVEVTYLQGGVNRGSSEKGPWQPLTKEDVISEGEYVNTTGDGTVELRLPDHSTIRLAPYSLYRIDEVTFSGNERQDFSARLFFGTLWAKVQKRVGQGRFDTMVPTAVVGVRGTAFNVETASDTTTDISVYAGTVGVKPPIISKESSHEEITWPSEVSEKKWEEIVVTRLHTLHIDALGNPGKPRAFEPGTKKSTWVEWNRKRDAL
jgi:hypothetical protein